MKTIDVEGCDYWIVVSCPVCYKSNGVEGHSSGHHPLAEILECGYCGIESWLGEDTEANAFGEPTVEVGMTFGS